MHIVFVFNKKEFLFLFQQSKKKKSKKVRKS